MTRSAIIVNGLLEAEDFDAKDWLLSQSRPDVQAEELTLQDKGELPPNAGQSSGKRWKIRIVLPGGCYGRENCLFHVERDPLIEFWDMDSFNGEGQFVSRYYWSTLNKGRESLQRTGLDLQGDVPAWKVSGQLMEIMFRWAKRAIERRQK